MSTLEDRLVNGLSTSSRKARFKYCHHKGALGRVAYSQTNAGLVSDNESESQAGLSEALAYIWYGYTIINNSTFYCNLLYVFLLSYSFCFDLQYKIISEGRQDIIDRSRAHQERKRSRMRAWQSPTQIPDRPNLELKIYNNCQNLLHYQTLLVCVRTRI